MKNTIKIIALLCAAILTITTLTSCDMLTAMGERLGNIFSNVGNNQEINISVLNGTTGFGAAKLINDSNDGNTALNYNFTVESDAANITAGLINGSIDIAALPTNAAAALYSKTDGGIKIAAVNTLGVLYLVTNGEKVTVEKLSDLEGMTIYCPAQNPAFIFKAICDANGVNVTIDTAYAQPADLRTALVSGNVDIAVLPEPMVTIAKSSNDKLTTALDLTEEWEKALGEDTLMQGCIVVRTEWADAHPDELEKFLNEYEASVNYTVKNPAEAAELIVATGVFAGKAPIAAKAIPNCNITYIDGEDMANSLVVFYEKLYAVNPQSVGGKIPGMGIYLVK